MVSYHFHSLLSESCKETADDHDDGLLLSLVKDCKLSILYTVTVAAALESAADIDQVQRQIAEENRLLKEALNSDDSVPEVNLPRKEFRILRNRELPMRFAHYDRVKLSQ